MLGNIQTTHMNNNCANSQQDWRDKNNRKEDMAGHPVRRGGGKVGNGQMGWREIASCMKTSQKSSHVTSHTKFEK